MGTVLGANKNTLPLEQKVCVGKWRRLRSERQIRLRLRKASPSRMDNQGWLLEIKGPGRDLDLRMKWDGLDTWRPREPELTGALPESVLREAQGFAQLQGDQSTQVCKESGI